VFSLTSSGRCNALETVIGETPAIFATSINVKLEPLVATVIGAWEVGAAGFFAMNCSESEAN
jgi:hypothetical protein